MSLQNNIFLLLLTAAFFCAPLRAQQRYHIGDPPEAGEGRAPKTEKVTYLGITAKPVDDTLRAQLNLADGVGLIVTTVDHKGPCADDIKNHDVLEKLDDQVLTDAHQLVTLVHLHKPGDTVTLTLLRKAETMQVKITLGEKEKVAPASQASDYPPGFTPDEPTVPFDYQLPGTSPQVAFSFHDDVYSASIRTDKDGHKELKVLDKSGKLITQALVDTPEQWDNLPADIQTHLSVMRDMVFGKNEPRAK